MNDVAQQAKAHADGPRSALPGLAIALLAIAIALAVALLAGCARPAAKSRFPEVAIHVTTDGFVPKQAFAPRGKAVTLVVTRDTDQTCATAMSVDGIDKSWDLPLHQAVRIDLPQGVADTLHYICGMGMERGEVIAQ